MLKNQTKKFMIIGFTSLTLLSLITAWIMANNLRKDESKERYKLTTDYKKIKEEVYEYKKDSAQRLYLSFCSKCHNENGQGTVQAPALLASEIVTDPNNTDIMLSIIIQGMQGKITRHNREYDSIMPSFKVLGHTDITHIVNYLRFEINSLKVEPIHPIEIVKIKVKALMKKGPVNASEVTD